MNKFYVYRYDGKDGLPYYMGKGKGKRCFRHNKKGQVNAPLDDARVIIFRGFTEASALAVERFWIKVYGRRWNKTGILRNKVSGGSGREGYVHSAEVKANMSTSRKGRGISQDTRAKISLALKGRTLSQSHRANLSTALKGHTCSSDAKAKMSTAGKGRVRSPDHCMNISIAKKKYYEGIRNA